MSPKASGTPDTIQQDFALKCEVMHPMQLKFIDFIFSLN